MNRTVPDSCLSNSHLTNLRSSNFNDNNNNNDNKKYFYIICYPHIGLSNILPSRADQGMQDGLIFTPRKQLYSVNVFLFFSVGEVEKLLYPNMAIRLVNLHYYSTV